MAGPSSACIPSIPLQTTQAGQGAPWEQRQAPAWEGQGEILNIPKGSTQAHPHPFVWVISKETEEGLLSGTDAVSDRAAC